MAKSREMREEVFVQELIKEKSQRQAYLVAYPHANKWTEKTIDNRASELFSKQEIRGRFNELKARLVKELEEECIIDAKEILKEYKKIAFSNIKDFLKYETKENMIRVGSEEVPRYSQVIEMKNSDEVDGAVIQEVSISPKGTFSFKLHNKIKALDKLAEYVGLIKEDPDNDDNTRDDGLVEQMGKVASDVWEDEENGDS